MWLQVINKVKITHQGQGYIKVKVKISSSLQTLCSLYSLEAGGFHLIEMLLVALIFGKAPTTIITPITIVVILSVRIASIAV